MPKQCRNDAEKEGAEVGTKDGAEVFGTTAAFPGRASLRPDVLPPVGIFGIFFRGRSWPAVGYRGAGGLDPLLLGQNARA